MGNIIYIPLDSIDTTMALNLSNNLVVNTNDLVVDTVNSKVGIGTDAPAYALDVHGTANVGALTATSISGPLSGNADTATQVNNLLTPGSYLTGFAYNGGTARTFGVDATTTNTVSKVVARDASGNFSAGTITATLSGVASSITNQENSATTTSTSVNTASTIVKRDASGDFSAGTITATLSGVASSITNQENSATTTSTSVNTASTIVKRDASGDFSAGTITATLSGVASSITNQENSATTTSTSANTANTIVKRDANGDFSAGTGTFSGDVTAFSDKRVKTDISKIEDPLNKVCSINGYTYKRIDTKDEKRHTGVIAQEVMKVLPEVVHGSEDTTYSVAYGNMVGLLIEAIKELKLEIDELKKSK
jgi:hypothetical protein